MRPRPPAAAPPLSIPSLVLVGVVGHVEASSLCAPDLFDFLGANCSSWSWCLCPSNRLSRSAAQAHPEVPESLCCSSWPFWNILSACVVGVYNIAWAKMAPDVVVVVSVVVVVGVISLEQK